MQEIRKSLKAGFIREIYFTIWLSNVVMVPKSMGKWRMCMDFTYLNKVCPKDTYLLPSIDKLVDGALEAKFLNFMDAYFCYNQIRIQPLNEEKTASITKKINYCYKIMPFELKNARATY